MKAFKSDKRRFLSDSESNLDALSWSIFHQLDGSFSNGNVTIRIGNTKVVIHSSNDWSKDIGLVTFKNKLSFIIEKIDEFLNEALKKDKKSKDSDRYWLNPNKGSEKEFTGAICLMYDKTESIIELSSCDRSIRLYVWRKTKEGKRNKDYYTLLKIKVFISECIAELEKIKIKE